MEISIRDKSYNPKKDSIDKKCKILIIDGNDKRNFRDERIYIIFNKVLYLEKEFYEEYNKDFLNYEALIIINDEHKKNYESIKSYMKFYKDMIIKIFACNLGYEEDKSLPEKEKLKKDIENIATNNGFKFFEYFHDSYYYQIKNIFNFIITELYIKYFSNEENCKLYQLNDLLKHFFNKEIEKGYFISQIKTLLEKYDKFEEINIDESKILIETYNLYSKHNKNYTLNEFIDVVNELNNEFKRDFIITCLINNIIYQGKINFKNENEIIRKELIKEKVKDKIGSYRDKEKNIIKYEYINNYYKDNEIIFSFYQNDNKKYEIIPIKVSDSNKKYNTELESICNEKLKIELDMKKCFNFTKAQKLEEYIKNNIAKELLDNNMDISDIIYMEEFEELLKISEKEKKYVYDEDYKNHNILINKLELLEKREETYIKNNNIIEKIEKVKYYHSDEKPIQNLKYNDFLYLEEKSHLVKFNDKKFGIISPKGIKIFDNNCKIMINLKIPINNHLLLKNGDIIIKTESSNEIQYIDTKTFKITKKYFLFSKYSIPLYHLNDGKIIFENSNEGIYIYESIGNNKYIIINYLNQIPIGIHQLNDNSIIIFKYGYMLQYSTKDFKLMNILENKYDNNKALNLNDGICIIYGGESQGACTRSIIYFIDRNNFQILSCFDSYYQIKSMVSTNKILFAFVYNRITTNRHKSSHKLNIYKINDYENVYLDSEDVYNREPIIEMITINELIIANTENRLISFKI